MQWCWRQDPNRRPNFVQVLAGLKEGGINLPSPQSTQTSTGSGSGSSSHHLDGVPSTDDVSPYQTQLQRPPPQLDEEELLRHSATISTSRPRAQTEEPLYHTRETRSPTPTFRPEPRPDPLYHTGQPTTAVQQQDVEPIYHTGHNKAPQVEEPLYHTRDTRSPTPTFKPGPEPLYHTGVQRTGIV
jgi:hypothetical protein